VVWMMGIDENDKLLGPYVAIFGRIRSEEN